MNLDNNYYKLQRCFVACLMHIHSSEVVTYIVARDQNLPRLKIAMFGTKMLRRCCAKYWKHFPVSRYKPKLEINVDAETVPVRCLMVKGKIITCLIQTSGTKFVACCKFVLSYNGFLELNISFYFSSDPSTCACCVSDS